MSRRQQTGATLALTAVLIIVIILIGIAFFVYTKMVGGSAELQHATDSGNLNVAVKVLKNPSIKLSSNSSLGTSEEDEFGSLVTNNDVNLLNFNKLVAKVALVEANAAAENTMEARDHADRLAKMLEGPDGIADRLYNELDKHDNLKNFFNTVTQANSVRMLNSTNTSRDVENEHGVAYFARGKATNVWIDPSSLPQAVRTDFMTNNTTKSATPSDTKQYLVGYQPITVPGAPIPTVAYGVPMRPGEQPHLVGTDRFADLTGKPFNAASKIVPNAFKSGGAANFNLHGFLARSAAVVGSLSATYVAEMPEGVIVVDNSGTGLPFSGQIPNNNPWLKLMQPEYVELMKIRTRNNGDFVYFSQHEGNFDAIKTEATRTFVPSGPGGLPTYNSFDNTLFEKVEFSSPHPSGSPHSLNGDDAFRMRALGVPEPYNSQYRDRNDNWPTSVEIHNCDNHNSLAMIDGQPNPAYDPLCGQYLAKMLDIYGGVTGGGVTNANNYMAIETFAAAVEASFTGPSASSGCALVVANPNDCTPLKYYKHSDEGGNYPNQPFEDNQTPATIERLLKQSNHSTVMNDLQQRMKQMKPEAGTAEINAILKATPVGFGKKLYIYKDKNSGNLVMNDQRPAFTPNYETSDDNLPDGVATPQSKPTNALGTHVDNPMTMWECPPNAGATSVDKSNWHPSSGYRGLLGVLEFRNCAHGGGNWCCP